MSANIYRTTSPSSSNYNHNSKRQKLNPDVADGNHHQQQQQHHHHSIVTNNTSNTATQVLAVASREQRIHYPNAVVSSSTKPSNIIALSSSTSSSSSCTAAVSIVTATATSITTEMSLYAIELDVAYERNKSQVFQTFYSKVWPLVRTIPEVLHHRTSIIQHMMESIVTVVEPIPIPLTPTHAPSSSITHKIIYVMNYATMDVLHLLGVLAREIRHEIHPYLHTMILAYAM